MTKSTLPDSIEISYQGVPLIVEFNFYPEDPHTNTSETWEILNIHIPISNPLPGDLDDYFDHVVTYVVNHDQELKSQLITLIKQQGKKIKENNL